MRKIRPAANHLVRAGRRTPLARSPATGSERAAEPVAAPLAGVAGHVVEAVAVRREGVHGAGAFVAVGAGVPAREAALPQVHPVLTARLELCAPRVGLALEPAARRILPFGFRRESLADGCRESTGVVPRDMHDGMVFAAGDARAGALRMAPVSPLDLAPPRSSAAATQRLEAVREESREDERPAEPLRFGDVAGVVDEAAEVRVRDCEDVDPEGAHAHAPDGAFPVIRICKAVLAPHQELPVRQRCHAVPIPVCVRVRGRPFHDRGGRADARWTLPRHGLVTLGTCWVTGRHSAGVTPGCGAFPSQEVLQSTLAANCFHASANAVSFGCSPATTSVTGLSVGRFCTALFSSSSVDLRVSVFAVLTSFASPTTLSHAA